MLRYLRLYAAFLRFSVSRALEFRVDFFFRIFMDIVYYAVNIGFFKIVYGHVSTLGGWTERQAMLFVSIYLVVDAVHMTVFANNLWNLPFHINSGRLDYYLTRPVSTLFFVSLRDFAASSAVNLVMALGIMVWAIGLNLDVLTPARLAALALLVVNGVLVHYLICLLFIIPVFWTHSTRGFGDAYHVFSRFMERPDRIFRGAMRVLLTCILPFALIASFPARLVLEEFDAAILGQLVVVTVGFGAAILIFWRRGLRAYSSASS